MLLAHKMAAGTWSPSRPAAQCLPLCTGEIKLQSQYCSKDLDLDSPFEVLLPRRRGLGLCSTALTSYLIALHNAAIYQAQKVTQEDSRCAPALSGPCQFLLGRP